MSVESRRLVVAAGAVQAALARLDHHHVLAEGVSVFAAEADGQRLGLVRPAAPPV